MIWSPSWKSFVVSTSASWVLSYESIDSNKATFFKNVSYLSLFFLLYYIILYIFIYIYIYITYIAASFTILEKQALSRANKVHAVLAMIFAARGALYRRASSPNASPG